MDIVLTNEEVRLIKKLLKNELNYAKSEKKIGKIFCLQNKLK